MFGGDILDKNKIIIKKEKFTLANAGCSNECTGLITVPVIDEDEIENYKKIYDFGPTTSEE